MSKQMELRGGNHYQVVSTVWTAKMGEDGQPIVGPDGKWVLAAPISRKCTYHNAVTTTMLGYEVAYTANDMTCVPVNRIAVLYNSGNSTAYSATTVADGSTGIASVWTTNWQNDTSAAQTVTTLKLINYTGVTADVEFATDTGLTIAVPRYAVLKVQWTHTYTIGGSDLGTNTTYTGHIRDCFDGTVGTSYRWTSCQFHCAGDAYYNTGNFTVTSGGTTSDTSVVMVASAANADESDQEIDELKVYATDTNGSDVLVFTDTGITPAVDWNVGTTAYATFTITWAVT